MTGWGTLNESLVGAGSDDSLRQWGFTVLETGKDASLGVPRLGMTAGEMVLLGRKFVRSGGETWQAWSLDSSLRSE